MRLFVQFKFCLVLAALAVLSACSTADNSEPPAPLTDIEKPEYVRELWTTDTGKGVNFGSAQLQPLLIGSYIYTIDTTGLIRKVDSENGKTLWSFESGLAASTGLSGSESGLLVTSRNGEVALYHFEPPVYDQPDLKLQWKVEIKSEILSRAVISDQQVFVRTVDGKLIALDAENGQEQWAVSRRVPALSLTGSSYPVTTDELVICGFDNGKLVAFDRTQGSTVWESTIASPKGRSEIERLVDLDGQFIMLDGVLYISSYQGNLVAVTVSTGQVIWSRVFSSFQAIDADKDALYLTDDRSLLWSIDRRTGSAFWQSDILKARKITAPRLIENKLVVADLKGYVHWFDKQDGRLLTRIATDGIRYLAQPVVYEDKVIVMDNTNQLTALTQAR